MYDPNRNKNLHLEVARVYLLDILMGKRMEIYDFKTNEIFVSRDVIFHEQIFPLSTPKTSTHLDKMDKCSVLRRDNRLLDAERSPREINPLNLSAQPICLGTGGAQFKLGPAYCR